MKSFQQLACRKALTGLAVPRVVVPSANITLNRSWPRSYTAPAAVSSQLAGLDASKLTITKTTTPKELLPPQDLVFGKTFTGKHLLS